MRILVAPNAFKNSLAAADVAEAIRQGLEESKLQCTVDCFPVGDGGDGTAELILKYSNGSTISATAHDPLMRKISSSFGLMEEGKTAVIEMANASGLRLLQSNELDPLHTSSFGTGELIENALDMGVNKIIMCIGGSATVDGAVGLLQALGFRFLDKDGKELTNMPETLINLEIIDFAGVNKRIKQCKIIVLCDVENALLGKEGAAAVFGPQKGADPDDVKKLEASLTKLSNIIFKQTGKNISMIKSGGAAGGTAAGLAAFLNADLVNGIDYFLSLTKFDEALEGKDLVITGEGSIDMQTLHGKGPFGVARRAKQKGVPVIGLAGKIPAERIGPLEQYFDVLLSINIEDTELSYALLHTKQNLERTSKNIGDLLEERVFNKNLFL
jgi:glycerate 2-kinase